MVDCKTSTGYLCFSVSHVYCAVTKTIYSVSLNRVCVSRGTYSGERRTRVQKMHRGPSHFDQSCARQTRVCAEIENKFLSEVAVVLRFM